MPRYFARISYKGTAYSGWQIQDNAPSVQEQLNLALKTILRVESPTTGCGRTDTGVHARQFYAHFDTLQPIEDLAKIVISLNALLPDDIAVHEITPVNQSAHARYDATKRHYEYFICHTKDPFLKEYSMLSFNMPDVDRMNNACQLLMMQKDFTSFSKSNTQVKTNICTIYAANWSLRDGLLVFNISADRFLRGMVRAIVGTMLEIGNGKMEPGTIVQIIESKNRASGGVSVPACGLFLTKVEYPYVKTVESMPFPALMI